MLEHLSLLEIGIIDLNANYKRNYLYAASTIAEARGRVGTCT